MERIIINNEPVEVPADIDSQGRAAVQAWHIEQLKAAKVPHAVIGGDPVELPPELAGKPKKDVDAWIADETERRADPAAHAAKKAEAAKALTSSANSGAPAAAPVVTN
jgi:hypothetical protein